MNLPHQCQRKWKLWFSFQKWGNYLTFLSSHKLTKCLFSYGHSPSYPFPPSPPGTCSISSSFLICLHCFASWWPICNIWTYVSLPVYISFLQLLHHKWNGLKSRNALSHSSGGQKFSIKVPMEPCSSDTYRDILPCLFPSF